MWSLFLFCPLLAIAFFFFVAWLQSGDDGINPLSGGKTNKEVREEREEEERRRKGIK